MEQATIGCRDQLLFQNVPIIAKKCNLGLVHTNSNQNIFQTKQIVETVLEQQQVPGAHTHTLHQPQSFLKHIPA